MNRDDPRLYEDDGLLLPEVGPWSITKHQKVQYYSAIFASSMKNQWQCRIYIDLFASAGKCKIRESNKIIPGSPLLALCVDAPFDKYIFCEENQENMSALQARVQQYFPSSDCSFILGNTNESLEKLFNAIPQFSKDYRGLTLCFVDPYKMGDLDFSTLRQLAERLYIDFLVLIPSYMDINRNEHYYTQDGNTALDKFLGTAEWRSAWKNRSRHSQNFGVFIADQFCKQMEKLEYIYETPEDLELVRMETGKNLPLYHLGFFSRNKRGLQFWRETRKNTNDQLKLL
jgi:three-Cys-motif partner protein